MEKGQIGANILSNGKDGLNGDVHDHHALSAEMEGQNLKGVGDKQTRETDVVEDTEHPDEDELSVSAARVGPVGVFVDGTGDGPANEGANHTKDRGEEERATTETVNAQGCGDGDYEIENGLAGGEGELLVLVDDTSALVDGVHIVGEESVTRVL